MQTVNEIKNIYQERKQNLFNSFNSFSDSLKFSMEYSLLIEEWIRKIATDNKYSFAITSAGSFSRRELSPYSDIDIMIVCKDIEGNESDGVIAHIMLPETGMGVGLLVGASMGLAAFRNRKKK